MSSINKNNSYIFAKSFLNSDIGNDILTDNYLRPYNSFAYMYNILKNKLSFTEGEPYDPYIMWMYGYLIKHWVTYNDVSASDVWKILPVDEFRELFFFYHTQGWNYIIADATKRYNGKNK